MNWTFEVSFSQGSYSFSVGLPGQIRKEGIGKTESAKITDTHGKEHSFEMVTLMLNDSGVKSIHRSVDRLTGFIQTLVPNRSVARHLTPQTGHR